MKKLLPLLTNRYIQMVLLGVVCVFGGMFLYAVFFQDKSNVKCASGYTLINPEPDCETFEEKSAKLHILQLKLDERVENYIRDKKAYRVSVFVRDLTTRRFAGVGENDVFYMASLLKVPLLIGGYKLAEVEPRILKEKVLYTGTPNLYNEQLVKPEQRLEVGKTYTIEELMRRSVVYSDNTSAQLLYEYYPKEFLDRIMQALGLEIVRPSGFKENPISARTYANVFRSLYNSSYLTREYSNAALLTLTETTYKEGAVAKIPASVKVAHKFAERTFEDPGHPGVLVHQLHECGIVYAKAGDEPYTFCILTEGGDFETLKQVIQDLSLEIYTTVTGPSDQ